MSIKPFAGIVWNEEAVYALAAPPNRWNREKFSILYVKIEPDTVQGSSWDPIQ